MLHVTIIILVCFTVSAPSEGIAVTRRKNYLFDGFCLFEEKVPKATEISSSNIDNVDEKQILDCVKHKITYRLSFFNNFFINQYQNRKNNYCSKMNSVLDTKKKISRSSVELIYRKRNLLWTRKGLESIKTLKPATESLSTTPKPLEHHTLNYVEKKRFFAIKKAKTQKRKRVRRHMHGRHSVRKSRNLRKQIAFSGPNHQLSEMIWDDYFEEKPRGSDQTLPRFHYLEKFIGFKKNSRGRESEAGKATHIEYNVPKFKHSHSYISNKDRKNARLIDVKNSNKENRQLSSNFNGVDGFLPLHLKDRFIQGHKSKKFRRRLLRFQSQVKSLPLRKNCISNLNQFIYDPRFKRNDGINTENHNELSLATDLIGSNEYEDIEETQHSNTQENRNEYDKQLDRSESNSDTKSVVPDYVIDEKQFKTKQEMDDFFRELLKASADYSAVLNEGFNSAEEPNEFCTPESTLKKPFMSHRKLKKEIPITDFDFPDYDEIYDPAADRFLKTYTPSHFRDRRKFKFRKNVFPKKKYSKIYQEPKSDSSCQTPLNFKRSLFFKKLERKKKFCGSRCSKSCGIPHKCWRSAPLLCIPYIRKSQDDLLKYLIRVMQNMLGKPYPQKLDIFENTKYKPSVKKCPQTTCEDIIPHDSEDEDDDDDDNCDSKSPCEPCSRQHSSTLAPCPPSACSPVPTAWSSCPKGCSKNSNEPSCPSFPCSLPNLNQIYTEPAACASDKCYSTLPPFLLPLSSIIQSGSKKDLSKKPDSASASVKPVAQTVKSLVSISNKDGKVLNDSESITFFPPKKLAPGYFKKAKEVNSDSLAEDNQLHSDQRLNDKILPEFVDYQEEIKLLNLTDNMSESTLKPSTSNEPFLFELPKFFGDEKHATDLSNPNINNSFARRDLNVIHEYDDEVFRSKNPANVSPKTATQIIHRIPSKQKHICRKIYYKPLPANEDNTYQSFPVILPQAYDEPQIDKPLYLRHKNRKYLKLKNRKSLKRHKREDYYDVDDFVNYDGYLYDTNGNNEDHEESSLQQLKKRPSNSDVNGLVDDYNWTPIQFEMFNELAKLVTGTEANEMSSLEPVSASPKRSETDLVAELSSTLESQLETSSVSLTTEISSTSVLPKEVSTIKTLSSADTQEYDTTSESKQTGMDNETRFSVRSSSTVEFQDVYSEKQKKPIEPPDVNTYIDTTEDAQVLTTVGSAFIVKGPKKQMTKPSPKMYTRVYPDSVPIESEKSEAIMATTTDSASKRNILLRTTPAVTSVTPDVKLQLLAVCEGYLEVVKVMKSQNQSFAGDLDSDLSSYCENIISQSLSQQTESPKSKKQELNASATAGNETLQNTSKKIRNLMPESKLDISSKLGDAVLKRELDDKKFEVEKVINTNAERNENTESPHWKKKQNVKKSKRKKEYQHENQKIPEGDDEFLKKGMTKEQVELLRLLKKRKRALLNWLFSSKEDQVQPEREETEYFDDNDESNGNSLNLGNSSGTVRPRGAKSSGKTKKAHDVIANDSVIPVYAKEYGYDKGGQLRQVEVLWRKVNDQTNEKQTYKNLSVLALVLTSTVAPNIFKINNNFFDINGYVNGDMSETRTKKENKAAEELKDSNNSSDVEKKEEDAKTTPVSNSTVTFIRKPHPSSIIGTEMTHTANTTKHPNITRKIAGKLNKAKGIVEEYTIEFWNYAVYILPIMFSILFLFCCACCAIHILRTKKKSKKKKKKKKQFESTDEEASTEETDSEPKKRRDKSKKSKKIWKVWKKNANDEANLPEKNKSFLRFLKSRKNDKAGEGSSAPYSALPEASAKGDNQSEAAERRELIALLEELKKIEMEQVGEKREQKSVQVQYMIQDHEEPVFKRPEMSKDHPFYSKNCRFHEPVADEFGIYRDAELNELLPCECGYYSKNRDCLRNYGFRGNEEGRCERLFNLLRNAGVCHHQLEKKKKFNDKDRNFIFDKYRNSDINDEKNEAGLTVKVCDMSEFNLPAGNPNDWVGEIEHFNNQVMKKKHVRLKDDGVLCRL